MAPTGNKFDKLTIIQWNIQGLRSKYDELLSLFNEKKLLVACLQETLLGDSRWQPSKKFKLERAPFFAGCNNRGVAMVLHSTLQYTKVPLQTTLEAVAITIHSGKNITICSIYLSPNSGVTKDELTDVIRQLPRPFLLLGDFNAKHPLWDGKNLEDQRGKIIEKLLIEESMAVLNDGNPTHFHVQSHTFSTIDLSLCSTDALDFFSHQTDTDLHGSDHFPLYLSTTNYTPQQGYPRWRTKKANWEVFSERVAEIKNIPIMDPLNYYDSIIEKITEAASATIPKSDGFYHQCPVPWWNNHCDNTKKERNQAQRQLFKHPTVANKIQYKRARAVHHRTIKTSKENSWKSYVSTINKNTECGKVWKKVQKIKGTYSPRPLPILREHGDLITSPQDVARAFGRCYQAINNKTKNAYPANYKRSRDLRRRLPFNNKKGHADNAFLNSTFSLEEMLSQLQLCKDTSPGLDDITVSMISHLPQDVLPLLLDALNALWQSKQIPDSWLKEIKLPFLKPGKDPQLAESYRPISLTSCVCKLFERMVNHRLTWFLERNNLLCPQQSGFRKNKSTMDAIIQLKRHIERGFRENKHTTAVFFDMEKAYDTVWRDEILNSLHHMGLRGNLPIFIQNFLSNREFCVRVGAHHSSFFKQEEGLPQGSVLSVTCFAVAINDIVRQVSAEVKCALYVDDFTIFISARNDNHSNRVLQNSINQIVEWTKTKGLKLSSEKTVTIKFEKRRKGNEPALSLYNTAIQVCESTKYLGIIMDKRLSWKQHVEHLRTKCTPAVNLIRHLSHLSWGADRYTLKHLYSALVQSKIDYGAHIYGSSRPQILDRLNPIQNACIRACTGAFKSSPVASLCAETGIPPLNYSRDFLSLKVLFKSMAHPNSPTHNAIVGNSQENPPPFMERAQALLTEYQISTPKIWACTTPEDPPWTKPTFELCPFTENTKKNKSDALIRSEFLAHITTP
ncbi:MAG: reverse transcriptase family protein [Cyanobacteria bacterium J06582_2]